MSAEDPKETLKTIIRDNITLHKDDETTDASVLVADKYAEEFWNKYNVIITIGLASDRERLINLGGTLREVAANYHVGVLDERPDRHNWSEDALEGDTGSYTDHK